MQKNSQDFSMQEALRLAKTPAGQQLLAMLQQADPQTLQKAMQQATSGNYQEASKSLNHLLSTPEAQSLMKELGK